MRSAERISIGRMSSQVALVCAIALTGGCSGDEMPAVHSGSRTLIVLPEHETVDTLAVIKGVLAVNDQGCFTVDGELLVLEPGAKISPDGDGIVLPNGTAIAVGDPISGSGGHATPRRQAVQDLQHYHLADAAEPCWGADTHGAVMVHSEQQPG